MEVTTGVLRGSRSQETDLYRVSQSETPRELLRSMSGTDRAVSMGVFSSKSGSILSSSPSFMSREGSRSQRLISALAHSRMLEFPEMAVDGSLGMSMSWGEGASWMPSSGSLSSSGLGGSSGDPVDSWKMDWSSSDIWHVGVCAARINSRRSFSFRRLAISVSRAAFSSSSSSVSFGQIKIQTSSTGVGVGIKINTNQAAEVQMTAEETHQCLLTACSVSVSSLRLLRHFAAAILFLSLLILFFSSSSGDSWDREETFQ